MRNGIGGMEGSGKLAMSGNWRDKNKKGGGDIVGPGGIK